MSEPTKDEIVKLEAEHGPCVVLSHPDGSCFVFKALDRDQFEIREARVRNGDSDADEKMLTERCMWPSRAEWNKYLAGAAFEGAMYVAAYKQAHGGKDARKCERFELTEGSDPSMCWLTNGSDTFGFRKPGRAEVKLWSAKLTGRVARQQGEPDHTEWLLRACGSPAFCEWLDRNLFGVGAFGDAFVAAFGASSVRVSGK